jgi:hypothetical protein
MNPVWFKPTSLHFCTTMPHYLGEVGEVDSRAVVLSPGWTLKKKKKNLAKVEFAWCKVSHFACKIWQFLISLGSCATITTFYSEIIYTILWDLFNICILESHTRLGHKVWVKSALWRILNWLLFFWIVLKFELRASHLPWALPLKPHL